MSQLGRFENIEWCDFWADQMDQVARPRVLLVGDSITRAYTPEVVKQLDQIAYVARLATSKCCGEPLLLDEVRLALAHGPFAVIHFNNGIHGQGLSERDYATGLAELTDLLGSSGSRLVWCSTTPVRDPTDLSRYQPYNQRILRRNAVAAELMRDRGIPIHDLYAFSDQRPELMDVDGVHFKVEGAIAQACEVAGVIRRHV